MFFVSNPFSGILSFIILASDLQTYSMSTKQMEANILETKSPQGKGLQRLFFTTNFANGHFTIVYFTNLK